ncbi:class I SAM-dependent methyltransferase [Nitrospirillum iridis]|uniref:SAM-dependent methyltransferase n=1 Tax=Nitrospirillum iridis TaxID=765888 RepID=A0A7X0EGM3_9PROT|nr:class I SAM-dependent methyltransferase [Nitrospirillum iridis]MBB6253754.1 SAM-dependent methyltransferase [Nitrospirillum iridis]
MTQPSPQILTAVSSYYSAKLAEHGAHPQGVDWKDGESQRLRHQQFLRLLSVDPQASVADLGCGYGDFLSFLRATGHQGTYAGYDVAPAMVDAARQLHGPAAGHDFHTGAMPSAPADYAVASGIFNVMRGATPAEWTDHVWRTVEVLARTGQRGFGFNLLSLSSDPDKRREDLFYADPAATLRTCLDRFGRHVALLQDYGLWEFTVLVRHP